jgi:chemotaxis protein MotB
MNLKNIIVLTLCGLFVFACVPARKYEELQAKQKACAEELEAMKSKSTDLETKNNELQAEVTKLSETTTRLKGDTALLGKSLRMKEQQYDKINELNIRIQEQLSALQKGSEAENKKLASDLEATKLQLQMKENELRKLEEELNAKKATLDILSKELESREKRVKELEEILAKQEAMVKALQEKVANALLGFKDKGLTVEQRNGKVYVSMEAKLLFPSGSTTIEPEGRKALIELAKVLQEQKDLEILVEGHTDTDAMKASSHPRDNWELSALRATSVVKLMLENSKMDPKTITAAGRSEYLPADPSNKAKNRRIEIILIPNLDELYKVIGN